MAAAFPTTAHTTNVNALSDLTNRVIAAGYTPNANLDSFGIVYSVLANLMTAFPPSQIVQYSATFDSASVTAALTLDTDVTLTGVAATDLVIGFQQSAAYAAGLSITSVNVKTTDTVTVRVANVTGGNLDPASITLKVFVIKALA